MDIPHVERPLFHIVAILGSDQPFFGSYYLVLRLELALSATPSLEGCIDRGLVLIGARFGGAIEPLLFRIYHLRFIWEAAAHSVTGSLSEYR